MQKGRFYWTGCNYNYEHIFVFKVAVRLVHQVTRYWGVHVVWDPVLSSVSVAMLSQTVRASLYSNASGESGTTSGPGGGNQYLTVDRCAAQSVRTEEFAFDQIIVIARYNMSEVLWTMVPELIIVLINVLNYLLFLYVLQNKYHNNHLSRTASLVKFARMLLNRFVRELLHRLEMQEFSAARGINL